MNPPTAYPQDSHASAGAPAHHPLGPGGLDWIHQWVN